MVSETEWRISDCNDQIVITIVGDHLVIDEKGSFLALMAGRGFQGRKSIPLRNITSIQIKPAGRLSAGYINFSYVGGREFKGGALEATRDPDSMIFDRSRNEIVHAFAAEVERRRDAGQSATGEATSSLADEVSRLADLNTRGLLTDDEFLAAKRKILGIL